MHCPFCSENDTKVIDSRLVADGHQVRRRLVSVWLVMSALPPLKPRS